MLAELKADHVKRNVLSRQKAGPTITEPNQRVHRLDGVHWSTELLQSISSIGRDEGAAAPAIQDALPPQPSPSPHSASLGALVEISDHVFAIDAQSSRSRRRAPTVEECMNRLTEGVQDEQQTETEQPRRKSVNGWTLHLSSMWSSISRRAGEDRKEWRLRVLNHARETWDVPW